jgi:hypothetical protein
MHLALPDAITPAWEGELELPATLKGGADAQRPQVTIGQPEFWPAAAVFDADTWHPPRPDTHYWLLRLACTLHPTSGSEHIREARQALALRPRTDHAAPASVYAFSLFPDRVTAEETREFTVSLGPELTFAPNTGISAGSVSSTLSYRTVFPVIQSYGAGEATPYWVFQRHASHPLTGSQFVYAILAAAHAAQGVRLAIDLVVTLEHRLGPIRFGLPREARTQARFIIH